MPESNVTKCYGGQGVKESVHVEDAMLPSYALERYDRIA